LENLIAKDGKFEIDFTKDINLDHYSSIEIVISDCYSLINRTINSNQDYSKVISNKKDLRLKTIKAEGKVYDTNRVSEVL